jgi:hypothetical protein
MAFDHVVVYHRALGRVAVSFVIVHGVFYWKSFRDYPFAFKTGVGALFCGLFIFVTSLNYFRRNHFNVFYWSHYAFIGFLGLAYIHVEQTKPFIGTGIALYVIDKLLRWVWMFLPKRTTVFALKSPAIVQVYMQSATFLDVR